MLDFSAVGHPEQSYSPEIMDSFGMFCSRGVGVLLRAIAAAR